VDVDESEAVGERGVGGGGRGVGRRRCGGVEVGQVEQALQVCGRARTPRRSTAQGLVLAWTSAVSTKAQAEEKRMSKAGCSYLLEAVEEGRRDVAQVQQEADQRHGRPPTCVRFLR
jgi:hypothetical protein